MRGDLMGRSSSSAKRQRWIQATATHMQGLAALTLPRGCTEKPWPNSRSTRTAVCPARSLVGYAYARLNERGRALRALDELTALSKQRYVSSGSFALVYIGLGDKDEAFRWLEKAYEEHSFALAFLKVSPAFDPLRSDSRFDDLL